MFDMFKDKIEMIPLYMESDPEFPNHHPDPSVESNNEDLKKLFWKTRLTLELASMVMAIELELLMKMENDIC